MADRPNIPDPALILAHSRVEFGIDAVLDSLFGGLTEVFDERPRGGLAARFIGKLPAVGVVGGFFDERKAIHKAASEAAELLMSSAFRVKAV